MLMERIERFRDEEQPNFTPYLPSDQQSSSDLAAGGASAAPGGQA